MLDAETWIYRRGIQNSKNVAFEERQRKRSMETLMKIYKVAVTEIYRKVVSVEAQNEREAHQRAWDAWNNTEIILDM
ncbi:MAG: DpnD/PcfM family protein, partial [Synergistaceae bacterium]|nr:DpnD/PcfM family protein [Synergistaceae bacterium]